MRSRSADMIRARACAALMLLVTGCAAPLPQGERPTRTDGSIEIAHLQRTAQSALVGSGNVQVHLEGDVVVVTGFVENAIDVNAVVRALERVEGVSRVESLLSRGM